MATECKEWYQGFIRHLDAAAHQKQVVVFWLMISLCAIGFGVDLDFNHFPIVQVCSMT
jgi:hypothetical protein